MPFEKGRSGNPGGRPKAVRAVEEAAREHSPLAVATLAEVCRDATQPGAARVSAANALLDRGWGKPTDRIQNLDENGDPTAAPVPALNITVRHAGR